MAFDQPTRNRLARFVGDARRILTDEFTRQCKQDYGIDPDSGEISDIARLTHLNDTQRATARILRDTIDHYVVGSPSGGNRGAIERIVREQAFTVLNRLCALRMAEAREILIEAVGKGYQSKGFQLYSRVAGSALGEIGDAYRCFLFSVFDEIATDLPSLFDRFSQQGRLFPAEGALLRTLEEINHPDIDPLWAQDETIGWLYQYFNSIEERKKMRDESAAPRNSRELAVRNQFFTPRYVVEFLTDNTLGRTWYEMSKGQTRLKEDCRYLVRRPTEIFLQPGEAVPEAEKAVETNLSPEESLRRPVHIPDRPLKDPRDIKMLDPACGSMHFGLYAFDLFERIYDEAWEIAKGSNSAAKSVETFAPFVAFVAAFPDKVAFLREVPQLIVERNIHGIDIDPRAVQIAGLSLWLRAQRAWHAAGMKLSERPRITRSNIVCAEPMPGETQLLGEFIKRQFPAGEQQVFGYLLEKVFNCMKLAGEAGALLRVEDEIRDAVAEAKSLWQRVPKYEQALLFIGAGETSSSRQMTLDLSGITDDQFWGQAEQRIYDALRTYAEQAETGGGFQRRLFADDAARGFAFIDICRKRYDVVLMNPPFGDASTASLPRIANSYTAAGNDIGATFVVDAASRWCKKGRTGVLLPTAPWFKPVFEKWRVSTFLGELSNIQAAAHLSGEVLDGATVNASPFVLDGSVNMPTTVVRLTRSQNPDADLENVLACARNGSSVDKLFLLPAKEACFLPNRPFCYWASASLRHAIASLPAFEGSGGYVRVGVQTSDEERFCRAWWEVPPADANWKPYSKSSPFSPFWDDYTWSERIGDNLREVAAFEKSFLRGVEHFGKAGVTYPSKSVLGFNVRLHPSGCGFAHSACVAFSDSTTPAALLAFLGSRPVEYLISLFIGDLQGKAGVHPNQYEVGILQRLPWPGLADEQQRSLDRLGTECVNSVRSINQVDEVTRTFVSFPWKGTGTMRETEKRVIDAEAAAIAGISRAREEIDEIVLRAYRFTEADKCELNTAFSDRIPPASGRWRIFFGVDGSDFDISAIVGMAVSYWFGCILGRWDVRLATAAESETESPDIASSPRVCPPGMLQGDDGLPLSLEAARKLRAEGDYPLDLIWEGILVDDPNHPLDIERRIRQVIELVFKNLAGSIEQEVCEILNVKSLRDYFRKPASFFADHVQRYSKSRRQAPIYWPLSTANGRYAIWIYYPRLNDQTLFTVVNNLVEPKLLAVSKEVTGLRGKTSRSAGEEAALEESSELEIELRDLRDELLRIAKFWKPNLNDGVQITAAPLWNLFRLKPWQKKLKETWDALEAGEYDWAHLAYSIWPARVREKCKTDKSLAIAHGLEALYQEPPASTTKKPRKRKAKIEDAQLIEESD